MSCALAVSEQFAGLLRQRAAGAGVDLDLVRIGAQGNALDGDADVQAVVAGGHLAPGPLGAFLRRHPKVRWLAVTSAGVDVWMLPEVVQGGITVTRTRHVHDVYVSEFAMALILLAGKRLPEIIRAHVRHDWINLQPPLIAGKTLVIVGYGEIGQALAKRARAFDMRVIGVRSRPEPDAHADAVVGKDGLLEALAQADFVVLIVPGGAQTRNMFAEPQLRAMPERAFLINVGRGEVVDEEALDRILREGRFAGALLDTTAVEPLPPESPLWSNARVLITSHLAGLRAAPMSAEVMDQVVANYARFARGEPLLNQVDTSRGY